MAAPPSVTADNLTGKFVMNKKLSDDPDPLFVLQGLSWLTRTAIAYATITVTVKTYKDKDSVEHIDITSVASGLSTTQENRTLDWQERDHTDKVFGYVKGKSRFSKRGEFEMVGSGPEEQVKFLTGEILKDGKPSHFTDDLSVQSWAVSQDRGWTAEQLWNFEEIDGKRFYTRRVIGRKDNKSVMVRLVYDYQGPPDTAGEDDGLAYGEE